MNYVSLSKTISHALRHEPEKYGLALKENGWIELNTLIAGIKLTCPEYSDIDEGHIERAVHCNDKKRHEINGDEIRALYGHSTQVEHNLFPVMPPEILYHGTTVNNGLAIQKEGIMKMNRQHVHLSSSIEDAVMVAKRRKDEIVILEVKAREAFKKGVVFFTSGTVWLCDHVPVEYILSDGVVKS